MLEISQNGKIITSITFPATKVGFETVTRVQVKNITEENIEIISLKFGKVDPDLVLVSHPKMLKPDEVGEMVLSFKPKRERTQSLSSNLDFDLVKG